ncbi:uncharacterized protein At4g17700 isoform X2 [Eutrema salsugineum]|uniref:uncharacterized protein At4g17700 isoform X2 n=1 Tax=Eutrema salsugineum TaxID=72664 RepID=UPI000CED42A1|nr:uncharacterized protein At4g17700 isoform X2 [Eutrema salsugineum]XP_024008713.1 uncharacterized protein At4g17700 isoform X2 [Eutrema salsugineum]
MYLDPDIKEQLEFWKRFGESDGFDVDHLMDVKPSSCKLNTRTFEDNDDYPTHIVHYAKMGLHKYNLIQGTNLQLSSIEKFNTRYSVVYCGYYITLIAKDPAAGSCLVPFQTRVLEQGIDKNDLTCYIARPKYGPPRGGKVLTTHLDTEQVDDDFYKGSLPAWPSEDAFKDKKRYYVMKKSELRKYDWLRLYMELAFLTPNLSKLEIVKVRVETKDNVEPPSERPLARNAIFYIRYRYYPNKARAPPKGHKPPLRDRIAIVRRTTDNNTGHLKLLFECDYAKTLL